MRPWIAEDEVAHGADGHGGKDANDGDDDEKLDEGKALLSFFAKFHIHEF